MIVDWPEGKEKGGLRPAASRMPSVSDALIKDFAMGLHEYVAIGYSFGASAPHNAAPQARRDW